jgi:hypothetical protein
MKESRNLARIVSNRRQVAAPLLDFEAGEKIKENRLVALLLEEKELTRGQLVRTLYEQPSSKNNTAFRQLHSRVFGKLLNNLYFLDHTDPSYSVSRRYQLECLDLMHKGIILYLEGDFSLAARICSRCVTLAVRDGFTSYAIEAGTLLRRIHADMQQVKQYRAIDKELSRLQKLRLLEEEADAIYAEVRLARTGTVAARRAILSTLAPCLDRLRQVHLKAQSPHTAELFYKTYITFLEQAGDYHGIIDFTIEAERQLQGGLFNPHRFDVRFNLFMKMYSYLLTQQPDKGLEVAAIAEKHFHPTAVNWLYFQEHHLLLALHAGKYDLARRVAHMALGNPVYVRAPKLAQQRWDLFGAYLDYVYPPVKPTFARRHQRARLGLSMPDYSRDKRGHNVAILISQVLHFLQAENAEALLLRIESLRKYRLRHLREAANQRTRLFLRLLELVADEQFDAHRCTVRAAPLLLQLASTPPPGDAYGEVEIVPYPVLWEHIMQQLRAAPAALGPGARPRAERKAVLSA